MTDINLEMVIEKPVFSTKSRNSKIQKAHFLQPVIVSQRCSVFSSSAHSKTTSNLKPTDCTNRILSNANEPSNLAKSFSQRKLAGENDSFYKEMELKYCNSKKEKVIKKRKLKQAIPSASQKKYLINKVEIDNHRKLILSTSYFEILSFSRALTSNLKNEKAKETVASNPLKADAQEFKVPSQLSTIQLNPKNFESFVISTKKKIKVKHQPIEEGQLKRKNNFCFEEQAHRIPPPKETHKSVQKEHSLINNKYSENEVCLPKISKAVTPKPQGGPNSLKKKLRLWTCF